MRLRTRRDRTTPKQGGERTFAPASAPVLEGQTRAIWVLGANGQPQSRRIKVGLTDGASTEVVEGNLQEGEMVIIGQTIYGRQQSSGHGESGARLWRRTANRAGWRRSRRPAKLRWHRLQSVI